MHTYIWEANFTIVVVYYLLSLAHFILCVCVCAYMCGCVIGPQVVDTMSDSTASSTTANDLDLIYLKGIMESPAVWRRNTHVHVLTACQTCTILLYHPDVLHVLGAGGELEGGTSVSSEGEQCGAPAGDPERPGPIQTSLQHCSRARQYSYTASLPGEERECKAMLISSAHRSRRPLSGWTQQLTEW